MSSSGIVQMRDQGMTWREIGDATGLSHEGARKAYNRARRGRGTGYRPVDTSGMRDPDLIAAVEAINRAGAGDLVALGDLKAIQLAVYRLAGNGHRMTGDDLGRLDHATD